MYLGKVVEIAPTQELFKHPTHPYTQALLSAAVTTDKRRQRIILEEMYRLHPMCHQGAGSEPRCWQAGPECSEIEPS